MYKILFKKHNGGIVSVHLEASEWNKESVRAFYDEIDMLKYKYRKTKLVTMFNIDNEHVWKLMTKVGFKFIVNKLRKRGERHEVISYYQLDNDMEIINADDIK